MRNAPFLATLGLAGMFSIRESAHFRLTWTLPQHPLSTSVCGIYQYRARRPSPDACSGNAA